VLRKYFNEHLNTFFKYLMSVLKSTVSDTILLKSCISERDISYLSNNNTVRMTVESLTGMN